MNFLLIIASARLPTSPCQHKNERFYIILKNTPKPHAESGAQKNPRRELILTGLFAENQKLKYGVDEIRPTSIS